jgi:N-acetylglucosamine-6-phosphate deacetylase
VIYIHNATLYTPAGKIEQGAILISGELISAVGTNKDIRCPPKAQRFDAAGKILAPGLIDLQVNGAFGMDFTTHPECIWQVGEELTRFGVTSFLPTLVSSPVKVISDAQSVLQSGPPHGYRGARAIGLHLEGPYINPYKCGAHEKEYICLPQPLVYEHWNPASFIRLATLAPEIPGALSTIRTLTRHGVVVGAGHSLATLEQAQAGIEAGLRYGTHLFNAMAKFDHREPGLAGALLVDERLVCGMIVDGYHLHPKTIELVWKFLGAQRTNLVSDCVAALGMPPGEYQLGKRRIVVNGMMVRLDDNTLAGSILSLDQALRNLITFTKCSLEAALSTVTQVPARLLKLDASLGNLVAGSKADLVLFNDNLTVNSVWLKGQQIRSIQG